jgi:hypothetical protein
MQLRQQDPHRNVVVAAILSLEGVRQVRKFYAEYSDYISRIRQFAGVAEWKDAAVVNDNIAFSLERAGDRKKMALWLRALPGLTGNGNGCKVRASTEETS